MREFGGEDEPEGQQQQGKPHRHARQHSEPKRRIPKRCRVALSEGIVAAVALAGSLVSARAEVVSWTCTNPASGATWTIAVDPTRDRVDEFPATVTKRQITWRDTRQGGVYELDRQSGALTVRFASSTGGYFLHDRCTPRG